jgi:hypothetical protein
VIDGGQAAPHSCLQGCTVYIGKISTYGI